MTIERDSLNPVLFPGYQPLQQLNIDLLESASLYDAANPNLITRLIPRHYLTEGAQFEAFDNEEGDITGSLGEDGLLGSTQLLTMFLYVWAKYFDELKVVADSFGRTVHVDYDENDNVPDQFLPFLANYYGIDRDWETW